MIDRIASTVVSVFTNSPANFQFLRHFRVTVYRAFEKNTFGWFISVMQGIKEALITLCKVIQTHTSLHSCSLRQWSSIDDLIVLGSICSLFGQPQFQSLTLTETFLSFKNIQRLVHTFLTTPCNGPQMLRLEDIHIIYGSRDSTAPSIRDSSFLLHKSLVLDCHLSRKYDFYWLLKAPLKEWLSTISKLQLHSR